MITGKRSQQSADGAHLVRWVSAALETEAALEARVEGGSEGVVALDERRAEQRRPVLVDFGSRVVGARLEHHHELERRQRRQLEHERVRRPVGPLLHLPVTFTSAYCIVHVTRRYLQL